MPSKEEIRDYQHRLEFEHELINRKLTWLLTSQSILFAALALAVRESEPVLHEIAKAHTANTGIVSNEVSQIDPLRDILVTLLPGIGFAISLLILIGVVAGLMAKIVAWKTFNEEIPAKEEKQPLGVRNWITYIAFVPDVLLPVAFTVAWYLLM